jgi:inner membrane protein
VPQAFGSPCVRQLASRPRSDERGAHPHTVRLCYKIHLEPITHFLTGAVLARAGFNRKTALATGTMTLAAEAPDLDVLALFNGPVFGFAHHRGFTHSFVGLVLVSAVVVSVMYCVWRLRGRKTNIPDLPPRWGLLFLFAYIAGLSHILLDFTNNYGVRPFWPFWDRWYSWDIVFILEPALYIFLVAAVVLPEMFSRRARPIRGGAAATISLIAIAAFYLVRDHEHRRAVHALEAMHFNFALPERVSAYPYFWNIFRWYAVAETKDSFATSEVDSRTGKLDLKELRFFHKHPETPATLAAKRSYAGQAYLDWAQYPYVTEIASVEDIEVHFKDLRFDYPERRGSATLSSTVVVDRDLHVVGEMFGTRTQKPPLD